MFCQLAGKDASDSTWVAGKLSMKDTSNAIRYGAKPPYIATGTGNSVDAAGNGYMAASSEDGYGILVGSDNTAESFEDYVLNTQIVDGTGAGELSHVASESHAITWTVGTLTLKNELIRYFNNNSGGSIDVNEVALVFIGYGISSNQLFLTARDVLGATVAIPNTGQLKVTYTVSLVYPA